MLNDLKSYRLKNYLSNKKIDGLIHSNAPQFVIFGELKRILEIESHKDFLQASKEFGILSDDKKVIRELKLLELLNE
jgi:hypothetical protein